MNKAVPAVLVVLCGAVIGCQVHQLSANRSARIAAVLHPWPSVNALVDPPDGWKPRPLIHDSRHTHEIWVSGSGDTAYGVIYFNLPLPVSAGFVLPFFMEAMRVSEGNAKLIDSYDDSALPGVRFIAEGGLYRIQVNLITEGFHGWAIYSGQLRSKPINFAESFKAEIAREGTVVPIR